MNAKKLLVVYLNSTKAVLGVVARRAAGEPPVADLVGAALPLRAKDKESGVAIAAGELGVKEVDYGDVVVRLPLSHGLDTSGAVVLVAATISTVAATGTKVTLTVTPAVAADKSAMVVIDAGANREPLKFTTKTTAGTAIEVPVTGVPTGSREVFVSVEGYVSRFHTGSF